jgi:bifunctional N-acetylglucosamine-1-phosphate-uridyltransferase/glucosamine-1-phosphate-acetyltransferase GlmU-like protein
MSTNEVVRMSQTPKAKKQDTIHVLVSYKFSKEFADLVKEELGRLYSLFSTSDAEWAKKRIEKIQNGLLSPDPGKIKEALTSDDE